MIFKHLSSMVLILLMSFNFTTLHAQINAKSTKAQLASIFKDYELIDLNTNVLVAKARSGDFANMVLDLGNGSKYNLELESSNLISPNYSTIEQLADGTQKVTYGTKIIALKGKVKNIANSTVALTLNDGFVYALIRVGQNDYFVEPLNTLVEGEKSDQFVFYNSKDVVPSNEKTCAAYEVSKRRNTDIDHEPVDGSRSMMACFLLEYNYASDFSMFQAYGSTTAVANFVVGVMNNVQTNYDTEFSNQVQFQLGQHFSSTCSTCDPWSSTTDAGDFLDSFTNWGPGGFSAVHDLAGIWTNRDFNGSTIGVAWLNGLCNSLRYHALQRWQTNNAQTMRCMVSHEIGHNFGCNPASSGDAHDVSGTWIMSPSVSTSNNWSAVSTTTVNAAILNANCLSSCGGGGGAPVASFSYNVLGQCVPAQVQYSDQSTNATSRTWSFPGGTPSTSTQANPLVTYSTIGTFNATLTATNNLGSNSTTINGVITTLPSVVSNFTQTISGRTVTFTFTGTSGAEREWNFGDGNNSFEANPQHTYAEDGVYTVTCTASNICSNSTKTVVITIATAPTAGFSANVQNGCQPLTVTFINQSSSNSVSYLWTFPGGSPATSTQANPTVNYVAAGNFAVTLRVTNTVGTNTLAEPNFINVDPLAVANFTSTQTGPSIQFTNMSQYSTSQSWSFGDGATSIENNPSHTYTQNGTFPVTLTANNGCGANNFTSSVTIAQPPVASFTSNAQAINCATSAIQFNSTSTFTPTSYAWEFEGGTPSTSTLPNPSISYESTGTFDVRLVVTNAFGSSESFLMDAVNVGTTPVVGISFVPDGLTYQFTSAVTNGTGVVWNFGDGATSSAPNPSHTYAAEGSYTVTYSAENSCGTSIATQVINVILSPTAGFSTTTQTVCAGNTVQFTSQSSPSTTGWLWTFEGGSPATSSEQNPIVTYAAGGTYDVSLTASNAAGQNTNTILDFITVNTVPSSAFQTSTAANVITLTNTGSGATTITWAISWAGGSTSLTGSPVSFTAPVNGDYFISQTNSNACGSADATTQTLNLSAYVAASMGYPATNCEDANISFVSTSLNATTLSWTFVGGNPLTSAEVNPIVSFSEPGTYLVTLVASNALGNDTLAQSVVIGLAPLAGFTFTNDNGNVSFTNTGNTNNGVWNFGDGSTSNLENPTHTYTASGTYTISQIVTNACGNDTTSTNVTIIISGTEDVDVLGVKIYPNPSNGVFTMTLLQQDRSQDVHVDLIDNLGRLISSKTFKSDIKYDLSYDNVSAGTYLLKVKHGQEASYIKMIITE